MRGSIRQGEYSATITVMTLKLNNVAIGIRKAQKTDLSFHVSKTESHNAAYIS